MPGVRRPSRLLENALVDRADEVRGKIGFRCPEPHRSPAHTLHVQLPKSSRSGYALDVTRDFDLDDAKAKVTGVVLSDDAEDRVQGIAFPVSGRRRERDSAPDLVWSPPVENPHGAPRVVPGRPGIQSSLDRLSLPEEERGPLPELPRSEEPLNQPVESRRMDAALHDRDTPLGQCLLEPPPELGSVIGHEETGRSEVAHRSTDEPQHPRRGRGFPVHAQRQESAREAIQERGDVEPDEQKVERRQIEMPGAVRGRGSQDAVGDDRRRRVADRLLSS